MGLKAWCLNMHISARNPNRKNAHKGGSGPLMSDKYSYAIETSPHFIVSGRTKSTSMPAKSTGKTLEKENYMKATSKQLTPELFPTTTSYVRDSLAKLSQLLEKGEGLMTPAGLSFLTSKGFVRRKSPDIFYSKMLKVSLVTRMVVPSRRLLGYSPTLGMTYNGKCLTVRTSESPRIGKECSLSDILEERVDKKYSLSPKQLKGIYEQIQRVHKKEGISPTISTPSGGHHLPTICE